VRSHLTEYSRTPCDCSAALLHHYKQTFAYACRAGQSALAARLFRAIVDVIRQLVRTAGGVVREMLGQVFAYYFDSGEKAAGKIALPELLGHSSDDVMPKLLANLLVDGAVA
jgi:hypothetical protein